MLPLDRRQFLTRLAVLAAGTAVASCSSGSDGGSGSTTTATGRRLAPEELPPSGLAVDPFRLGVASGDPTADSVVLWTRLAVEPGAADGSGGMGPDDLTVRWELSADDRFAELVASGDVAATAALAHSVHVDLRDLEPDTWYHYRFRVGEHTSPTGRARTAPADDAEVESLRFAMASCQDYQAGHYAAHRAIAADELDLVVFLGDYIYEYAGTTGALRTVPGGKCTTLADYRNRYAHYKLDPSLQAAHAACPWIVTWDDHEVENNYAADASEVGTAPAAFAEQRAAAYQAYYEHQPVRLPAPTGPDWPIHRSARWGRLVDLFVLDGRQYRDDQPCNASYDLLVPRTGCDPADEDRAMLGEQQTGWLLSGLSAATATWKVLAQQTVMSALVMGDIVLNVDQWDGYPRARRRLLEHIRDEEIRDVVVLTGDIHAAAAGVLRVDPEDRAAEPVAVELVCTSVSSSGLVEAVGLDPATIDPASFGLAYAELLHRGYSRCTVTPSSWTTEYVVVDDASDPQSGTRVDATLRTDAGAPSLTLS